MSDNIDRLKASTVLLMLLRSRFKLLRKQYRFADAAHLAGGIASGVLFSTGFTLYGAGVLAATVIAGAIAKARHFQKVLQFADRVTRKK